MKEQEEYRHIPVGELHESKHNPRRHFDGKGMEDLVASIREVGVLDALIVRPNAKGYEIAAGHRRYRAAKIVELATLPCRVRELTDQQLMEILNISNLQREDVHPLDEAGGYDALMKAPYHMKVEVLAQKVGKSTKYIYDRRKLLDLTKPARGLFWAGTIDAGHAIHLARLTPTEQAKVIGTVEHEYKDGGLLIPEYRLFKDDEDQGDAPQVKAVSVLELQAWINEHIRYNHRQVDAFLNPDTAAQVTNATEMKRKIIEITHEFLAKDDVRHADKAKVYGERAWARADGQEDSQVCDFTVLGVIASGPGRGEAFDVCIRKDKCLVHWGKEIRAREKREKDRAKGNTAAVAKADVKAQQKRQEQEDGYAVFQRKRKAWEDVTPTVMKLVEDKVASMPAKSLSPLGDFLVRALGSYGRAKTGLSRGKTAEDLVRYLAGMCLYSKANDYHGCEEFPKFAKQLGIDLKDVLKSPKQVLLKKGKKAKAA